MPKPSARRRIPSKVSARTPKTEKPAARAHRNEYLTPTQVADRLLVATVTVRLWASKGLLPSVTTLGGHRRFRTQDVEAFVAQHQQLTPMSSQHVRRVLIIDDDQQFSRYLSGVISAHVADALVEVANDGFTAGVKCQSNRPDIVTLDLQMPEMDGFQVCSMLRSMFDKAKPRIVALTAFASAGNMERIIAAGADSCVPKTASADVLLREMGLPPALKT